MHNDNREEKAHEFTTAQLDRAFLPSCHCLPKMQALLEQCGSSRISEIYLIFGIHLSIESNLRAIFIFAKSPWLSKIYTYFNKKTRMK